MQVLDIWRYPVKSMQGEPLTEAAIDANGIEGDRGWSLVDADSGLNLTARREPKLLEAAARITDGELVITLPDRSETTDDDQLSAWIGRPVRLAKAKDESVGTFETQADETESGQWFQWSGPAGSFHDSTRTKLSLITAGSFRHWEPRRFRINVVLDGQDETSLVGAKARIGSTELDVTKQIDRCVVTTRPQPALGDEAAIERDLSVLRTINKENEGFLGIGCLILKPGRISVGDSLTVEASA